eukprot:m.270474 g.270474  ORF g.270474 m.270474 type:complete len:354 (+) comp19737_c2_seq6:1313-2374(+)
MPGSGRALSGRAILRAQLLAGTPPRHARCHRRGHSDVGRRGPADARGARWRQFEHVPPPTPRRQPRTKRPPAGGRVWCDATAVTPPGGTAGDRRAARGQDETLRHGAEQRTRGTPDAGQHVCDVCGRVLLPARGRAGPPARAPRPHAPRPAAAGDAAAHARGGCHGNGSIAGRRADGVDAARCAAAGPHAPRGTGATSGGVRLCHGLQHAADTRLGPSRHGHCGARDTALAAARVAHRPRRHVQSPCWRRAVNAVGEKQCPLTTQPPARRGQLFCQQGGSSLQRMRCTTQRKSFRHDLTGIVDITTELQQLINPVCKAIAMSWLSSSGDSFVRERTTLLQHQHDLLCNLPQSL